VVCYLNKKSHLRAGECVDLVLATMSPFESSYIACDLSQHFGVPWIADLRNPWALDEVIVYPTALHRVLEKQKMKRVLSTASLIIMNTPKATIRIMEEFYCLRGNRVCTITNGFEKKISSKVRIPKCTLNFGSFIVADF